MRVEKLGIEAIAMEFCGRGGKRLRPRLCKAAFEDAKLRVEKLRVEDGGDDKTQLSTLNPQPSTHLDNLCEAVECFHKASLIHDDIQDGDEERYGRPTVWKEHGVAVAIAAGDWLVAHGYELIINSGFPNALAMVKATVASHVALCEGQGDDLLNPQPSTLNPQPYLSICERKTGEAFALAAELGALAAGVDGAPYRQYGLDFGVLFQVRDDLADGEAPEGAAALEKELACRLAATSLARSLGEWYK